jgi:nucleotide-binding universal stress UspA family protein
LLQVSTEAAEIVVGSDNPSWFTRRLSPAVSRTLAFTAACPVVVVPERTSPARWTHGVVAGIEGAHPEEHVLRYAFEHADHMGRELQVVHALPVDSWVGEVEAHEAAVSEALAGWGEKYPDVTVTRRFVRGEPTRVGARATMNAELVVIGQPRASHVPFGFDEPMSNRLLQRACGPVAIVPDPLS